MIKILSIHRYKADLRHNLNNKRILMLNYKVFNIKILYNNTVIIIQLTNSCLPLHIYVHILEVRFCFFGGVMEEKKLYRFAGSMVRR